MKTYQNWKINKTELKGVIKIIPSEFKDKKEGVMLKYITKNFMKKIN